MLKDSSLTLSYGKTGQNLDLKTGPWSRQSLMPPVLWHYHCRGLRECTTTRVQSTFCPCELGAKITFKGSYLFYALYMGGEMEGAIAGDSLTVSFPHCLSSNIPPPPRTCLLTSTQYPVCYLVSI